MKRIALLLLGACTPEEISLGAWELDASMDAYVVDAYVAMDARLQASPYFEAEDGVLSGFERVDDGTAIAPPAGTFDSTPGEARAVYRFSVPRDASYVLWGRIQSPGASNNRVWFAIDDGAFTKWRISTGDIFYWDDLHDDANYGTARRFELRAGEHTLTLANCTDGIRLDRFYITADGDTPPGNTTICRPPHSIEIAGACQPSCGAQNGRRCGEQACAGRPLITAYDCAICCSAE